MQPLKGNMKTYNKNTIDRSLHGICRFASDGNSYWDINGVRYALPVLVIMKDGQIANGHTEQECIDILNMRSDREHTNVPKCNGSDYDIFSDDNDLLRASLRVKPKVK